MASGRVRRRGYEPVLYGNYLTIGGAGERRGYFYAHLIRPPAVRRGQRVWAGQRVGAAGATGNARSVGCHLHFEVRARGRPVDPAPILRRWGAAARWSAVETGISAPGAPVGLRRRARRWVS